MSSVGRFSILVFAACGLSAITPAQDAGQQVFNSTCAGCHGLDGRGGEHGPNIAGGPRIEALTDPDLAHIITAGIPNAGMPSFGRSLNDDHIRAVVAYLRTLQGKGKTAEVTGDAEHGRALFFGAAGCSSCHTLNGKGGFLGPDLSNYAATHTAAEIRESMVNPNPDQDTRRGAITVVTNAGKKFTGVLRNEDNFSLQMQTSDGNFHFFDKSDLASIERSTKSLMPTNYESKLGKKGMDDLVSFLMKAAPGSARSINNDDDQ